MGKVQHQILFFLDLNLPKKNEREVLKEIKYDRSLKQIPVVVLTISSAEEDIAKSHENLANCYIIIVLNMQDSYLIFKTTNLFNVLGKYN